MEKAYIAIDMKSFYASVECVQRRLNPLRAYLLVADESRTDKTICLAVSPALKAIGADAILLGEALMRAADRRAKLAELRGSV